MIRMKSHNLFSMKKKNNKKKYLTHLSLASHKRDIGRQCRPRSDAAECGVWSGSTLFALNSEISLKYGNNKTNQIPLLLEMDCSEELR